jgi:hypothetical protein
MFPLSKRWMMLVAIGHGILFSFALTALMRIVSPLCGIELPEPIPGRVFLFCSVLAGAISAHLCARSMNAGNRNGDAEV